MDQGKGDGEAAVMASGGRGQQLGRHGRRRAQDQVRLRVERIWGDQGHAALEKASICLLNCGPTGTEALKNLVLGGIGSATVVDGSKVEPADLGNNFLLDEGCFGQSRAKSIRSFLQEALSYKLNDVVKTKYVEESPATMIAKRARFFRGVIESIRFMEKIMEQEGKVQGQRASVPAFGEWDEMKAAGVTLDYSLDFTKIRAARMQRKSQLPTVWSSAGSAPEVAGGNDDERNHHKPQSEHGDDDRRRHAHHRRQHSDHTDLRRPLRPDRATEAPKGRSKVKEYLFGCVGGW